MAAKKICGELYKINYYGYSKFVECDSRNDLFTYVAQDMLFGEIPQSAVKINADGTTPKIKMLTDPEFKRIRKLLKE